MTLSWLNGGSGFCRLAILFTTSQFIVFVTASLAKTVVSTANGSFFVLRGCLHLQILSLTLQMFFLVKCNISFLCSLL